MTVFGLALSLPLIAIALLISAVPVWLAAKIVGAGRQELWRAALALVLATLLAAVAMVAGMKLAGPLAVLVGPVVFVVVIAKVLEVSYLGAFILCILSVAIQVAVSKVFARLFGG